jgi:hypothetical protein
MSASLLQGVTHACFGLSYLVAFVCEAARRAGPGRGWLRPAGLVFGAAGLTAQTLYLVYHRPSPAEPYAALLFLALVLAVFSLYGTVHHARQAWAVFVLPVVLGLVGLSFALVAGGPAADPGVPTWLTGDRPWGIVHGVLLLLAAVGVSVAFLASVMYLVQVRRLRTKRNPLRGLHLLSLERLEAMNRRGVNAAFPLLAAGVLLGQLLVPADPAETGTTSVKILGSYGLAGLLAVLVYLRYAAHATGRRLAVGTIVAFVLLVAVLAATHPFVEGGK